MYATPIDIANRALQHCGKNRIFSFEDQNPNSQEIAFVYHKVRRAELRRNVWRFATRRAVLRPLDFTTMSFVPDPWSATTAYGPGAIVSSGNEFWVSTVLGNTANPPSTVSLVWGHYFGPLVIDPWQDPSTTQAAGYFAGELVYVAPGTGTYTIYQSLLNANTDDPTTPDAWNVTWTYYTGQVVSYNGVNYQSLVSTNIGQEPDTSPDQWTTTITSSSGSLKWMLVAGTLAPLIVNYPLSAGPASDYTTRSAFRLPNGFLREAPQDPKRGSVGVLGAPSAGPYTDWEYEGNYLVSQSSYPIVYRFVADIADVTQMDDMFCEGVAARAAMEVGPVLDVSAERMELVIMAYKRAMEEARTINGIETGTTQPALDDYLACRY